MSRGRLEIAFDLCLGAAMAIVVGLVIFALLVISPGCAFGAPKHGHQTRVIEAKEAAPRVSGEWMWVGRGRMQSGDYVMQGEWWHIQQVGSLLTGYYDRRMVVISGDDEPFSCNGQTTIKVGGRVAVEGKVNVNGTFEIREVGYTPEYKSPECMPEGESTPRNVYHGERDGDDLVLHFGENGTQTLHKAHPPEAKPASQERAQVPTQRFYGRSAAARRRKPLPRAGGRFLGVTEAQW